MLCNIALRGIARRLWLFLPPPFLCCPKSHCMQWITLLVVGCGSSEPVSSRCVCLVFVFSTMPSLNSFASRVLFFPVLPRRFMQLQFSFIPALTHPSDSGGASLPHRESPPRAHMPLPSALSHRATLTLIPHRPVSSALCPFAPRRAWLSHGAPRRPRPAHPAPPAAAAPARGRRVPPCSNRRVLSTPAITDYPM